MNKQEFISKLKEHGIERNVRIYKESFTMPLGGDATEKGFIAFHNIYNSANEETKLALIEFLRQVVSDGTGILLSLFDGSTVLEGGTKFFLAYKEGEKPIVIFDNPKDDDFITLLQNDDDVE